MSIENKTAENYADLKNLKYKIRNAKPRKQSRCKKQKRCENAARSASALAFYGWRIYGVDYFLRFFQNLPFLGQSPPCFRFEYKTGAFKIFASFQLYLHHTAVNTFYHSFSHLIHYLEFLVFFPDFCNYKRIYEKLRQ